MDFRVMLSTFAEGGKIKYLGSFLLTALLLTSSLCYAKDYPTDIDLKTAYCIRIQKNLIALVEPLENYNDESIGMYQEEIEKLKRMQAYLIPKIPYLKIEPLMIATQSAEKDLAASSKSRKFCSKKHPKEATETIERRFLFNYCLEEQDKLDFGREARTARMQGCHEPTWLPY